MTSEPDVWAPPITIGVEVALPLYASEAPLQEFSFIVPRSETGALQLTCYPPGSYVQLQVEGTDFAFTGVVTEVDLRNCIVTAVI